MARLEGKVDSTLVDHARRLSDLETSSRMIHDQIHTRLNSKARTLADHAARLEDLEEDQAAQLPRAAQASGILTGIGALAVAIWARIGG